MTEKTIAQAVTEALDYKLATDDKTIIFGEDVGKNGGVFRITDGLQAKYGDKRVLDTPLAESGILGLSIGLAAEGFRPIPEIQFLSFILEGFDAVYSQLSRFRYRSGNTRNMPVTIRSTFGGPVHTPELHSDSLDGLLAQIPGLRVVVPSNPYDAKGLLISAIESNDPVVFLEHLKMYRSIKGDVPEEAYRVPLDKASVVRKGTDVSIITYGLMVHYSLQAAEELEKQGISVEVVDLRTVSPIDMETVITSVKKTGRVIVVQESQRQAGVAGQLLSEIAERAFMYLDAPVGRVTSPDTTFAFGLAEDYWLPTPEDIIAKAKEIYDF
ncbi:MULTISPECIES: alpha-ketoacid dehydrogenase subunit beta [Gemella]|uniref:alpha-ketoacid dehydrogenase subunit beta n=1 Tax=Gemella TaxID=1378 RepID=UPI0007681596|nr:MULTISPECIES: alpha-ketoacid dehydrogenase subunit beta [Gemella]AME09511.1 2-oxoisovalerate dehydrogenase [Gemella sp. oral taxon 928]AXI27151.1 alpha-ketoacid dehydrogenase subunit beta [Gemella sp. ND 6198]